MKRLIGNLIFALMAIIGTVGLLYLIGIALNIIPAV